MLTPKGPMFIFLVIGLVVIPPLVRAQQAEQSEREAMYYRYLDFASYVKDGKIEPHWMDDDSSFWYAEGASANTVIYKVDPIANAKTPVFDTVRVRQSLTTLLGHEPPYQGLPFDEFTFVDRSEQTVKFTVEEKEFTLEFGTYTIRAGPVVSEKKSQLLPHSLPRPSYHGWIDAKEERSPDGHWFATIRDRNLWLRPTRNGGWVQLATDGIEDYEWDLSGAQSYAQRSFWKWAWWASDSSKLALKRVDYRQVPKIPIVHQLRPREEVEWVAYPKAGEPWPKTELFVIDVISKRRVRVDSGRR